MNRYEAPTSTSIIQRELRQFLRWLVLSFLALGASSIVLETIYMFALQVFGPDVYNGHTRNFQLLSLIPESFVAGIIVAILVGHYWKPPIRVIDWRWLLLNALYMSIGNLGNILIFDWVYHYSYPVIIWIIATIMIGILFGIVQWLYLRRNTRHAGWWIPAMASSWTVMSLLWFLWCILSIIPG